MGSKKDGWTACTLIAASLMIAMAPAAFAGWTQVSPTRGLYERGQATTLLLDGRVLVVQDGAELYDPKQLTWSSSPMGSTHVSGMLAVMLDGRVLVVGSSFGPVSEIFDPATGRWAFTTPFPVGGFPYYAHAAVTLLDGRVLVCPYIECALFDPSTETWSGAGRLAAGIRQGARLPDGRVLMTQEGRRVDIYDPTSGTWSAGPDRLYAASSGSALVSLSDGSLLFVSGTTAELFDPATESWRDAGRLNVPRINFAAARLAEDRVIVSGGRIGEGDQSASSEVYDPVTNTWTVVSNMNVGRYDHSLVGLADGSALAIGGISLYYYYFVGEDVVFYSETTQSAEQFR